MSEATADTLYSRDDSLMKLYSRSSNGQNAREFALSYAALHRDFCKHQIGCHVLNGKDYFKIEFTVWNHAIEQADRGNYHPLRQKLQYEARDFFESEDTEVEVLATSLINLARYIA